MNHRILAILLVTVLPNASPADQSSGVVLKHLQDIPAPRGGMTMTMSHDLRDMPYLYVAAKEAGLAVYDIKKSPSLVSSIPTKQLRSLSVMSLSQSGRFLYLVLGNTFARGKQHPGLAVVDVHIPSKPRVLSVWSDPKVKSGAGIVQCAGDYAYMGVMEEGLKVFDISNKKEIRLLSSLVPEIRFPDKRVDPRKVNARGMAVRGDLVYLCYDAGGFRVIDVSNRKRPREIGRYSNPAMNRKPRAYNNVVLDWPLAYVAVDYFGIEVLDVRDPTKIKPFSWWNPWNPELKGLKWFTSPGHTNELAIDRKNKLLFVSTGKTDMHVLDIRDPASMTLSATFGADNKIGTWGVSRHKNRIFLSYIRTLGIPFKSNWSGVKILQYGTK